MVESSGDRKIYWCILANLLFLQHLLQFKWSQFPEKKGKLPINAICHKSLISYLPFSLTHQHPEGKKKPKQKTF